MQLELFAPTLADAQERGERAMASVSAKAEERSPGFAERARECALRRLREGPATAEELTDCCLREGVRAHDLRAFGPVYASLARKGLIVRVGEARRRRGHGTHGGGVWALA